MLAHLQYMLIRYKVSLNWTYCHKDIYKNNVKTAVSLFKHVDTFIKIKLYVTHFPPKTILFTVKDGDESCQSHS